MAYHTVELISVFEKDKRYIYHNAYTLYDARKNTVTIYCPNGDKITYSLDDWIIHCE